MPSQSRSGHAAFELQPLEPRVLLSANTLVAGGPLLSDALAFDSAQPSAVEEMRQEPGGTVSDSMTGSHWGADPFAGLDATPLVVLTPDEEGNGVAADANAPQTDTGSTVAVEDTTDEAAEPGLAVSPDTWIASQLTETLRSANGPPIEESELSGEETTLEAWSEDLRASASSPAALLPSTAPEVCTCEPAPAGWSPQRPLLLVPGIGGTYAADGYEDEFLLNRGLDPAKIAIDPLTKVYDDLIKTLVNVGYRLDQTLFVVNYDWRMNPGPQDTSPNAVFDGKITGLTAAGLTDTKYEFGVDYLGVFLKRSAEAWKQAKGAYPATVDIIAHSTGGLVSRVYIQSDAYGTGGGVLPKVNDLIMMGVPNRGASKAWNILGDNWVVENAYRIVLSKIVNNAYEAFKAGKIIRGPDVTLDKSKKDLNHLEFINAYVPTARGLLATYPFLDDGTTDASGKVQFKTVNDDPASRNWLLLDLNDGLDADYPLSQVRTDGTYVGTNGKVRKPVGFVDLLQGQLTSIFSGTEETPTNVVKRVGPTGPLNEIVNFHEFVGELPAAGEVWYEDRKTQAKDDPTNNRLGGDGTVPLESSRNMFQVVNSSKIKLKPLQPGSEATVCDDALDHTSLMWAQVGQMAALDELDGLVYTPEQISRCSANNSIGALAAAVDFKILTAEQLFLDTRLDDVIRGGLIQGFNRLAVWGQDTSVVELLNQPIPVIGQSLQSLVKLDQVFGQVAGLVGTKLSEAIPLTGKQVVDWLRDLPSLPPELGIQLQAKPGITYGGQGPGAALGASLGGIWSKDEFAFSLGFTATRKVTVTLDVGANAQSIRLGADAEVEVMAGLDVELTFGYDRRATTAADDRFFFRFQKLELQASLAVEELDAGVKIGFIGAGIRSGEAQLRAALAIKFNDPNKDGRITLRELKTTPLLAASGGNGPLISLVAAGSLCLRLPVAVNFGGLVIDQVLPEICVTDGNLFDQTLPSFDLQGDFSRLLNLQNLNCTVILGALRNLPNMIQEISRRVGGDLPVVGSQLSGLLEFSQKFSRALDGLECGGEVDTINLMQKALDTALEEAGLNDAIQIKVDAQELKVILRLKEQLANVDLPFSFTREVGSAVKAGFSVSGEVRVKASLDVGIAVGIDYSAQATDRVYVIPGPDTLAKLAVQVITPSPYINASASLGLLGVDVVGGKVTVAGRKTTATGGVDVDETKEATISVVIADPNNSDGRNRITLAELTANLVGPTGVIRGVQCDGAARIVLPIKPILGKTPQGVQPRIELFWSDLCNPLAVTPQFVGIDEMVAAITDFSSDGIIDNIAVLIERLDSWSGLNALQFKVPWIELQVSDLLGVLTGYLKDFFNDLPAGTTSGELFNEAFDTAVANLMDQLDLEEENISLVPVAGAFHDPANGAFRYLLHVEGGYGDEYPFSLGSGLFTLETSLQVGIRGIVDLEFGFNSNDGFYLVDRGGTAELRAIAEIGVDLDRVGGSFGPLKYGVHDGRAQLNLTLFVDLKDTDGTGGRISLGELTGSLERAVVPGFQGTGDLNLPLGIRFGADGPGVTTCFKMAWDSATPSTFYFTGKGTRSEDPIDGFCPVNFELGEMVGKTVAPILQEIQKYNPFKYAAPVLDFLFSKLPVVEMTPLDILGAMGSPYGDIAEVLNRPAFKFLIDLTKVLDELVVDPNSPSINLSAFFAEGEEPAPANPSEGSPEGGQSVTSGLTKLRHQLLEYGVDIPLLDTSKLGSSLIKILLGQDVDLIIWTPDPVKWAAHLDLPDIPLISYGIPGVASVSANLSFGGGLELFANPQFGLSTRGLFQPDASGLQKLLNGFWIGDNIKDGEDAFEIGISFFVNAKISGKATVLGYDLIEVYGKFGIETVIGLDLADVGVDTENNPNAFEDPDGVRRMRIGRQDAGGDGRVYFDEIGWLLSHGYGIPCILTLGGSVKPYIELGAEFCVIVKCFTFSTKVSLGTLVDFDLPCTPSQENIADVVGDTLVVGQEIVGSNSDLDYLFMLTRNDQREVTGIRVQAYNKSQILFEEFSFVDPAAGRTVQGKTIGGYLGGGKIKKIEIHGTQGKNEFTLVPELTYLAAAPTQFTVEEITIRAGAGDDTITFGNLDLSRTSLKRTALYGDDGHDKINGTKVQDFIDGGAGDDEVGGYEGEDEVRGGDGQDKVYGGQGADLVAGMAGDDEVDGQEGNDRVLGGDQNDLVLGGKGDDDADGENGDDEVRGGIGSDFLAGSAGNDVLMGEGGADVLRGGLGNDVLYGHHEPRSQTVAGGAGGGSAAGAGSSLALTEPDDPRDDGAADELFGDEGDDQLYGQLGDDDLHGGDQNDLLIGGAGADVLRGGRGDDRLFGHDQQNADDDAAKDQLLGDEDHDVLFGAAGDDVLRGGSGNDVLHGQAGNDDLDGEAGDDVVNGQAGRDVARGGAGNDQVFGQEDEDELYGNDGDDEIHGNEAADRIWGGAGRDRIFGDAGDDTIRGETDDDVVEGGDGMDVIYGGDGADLLSGGKGADRIYGGAGSDTLYGHAEDAADDDGAADVLFGDEGADRVFGNAGDDQVDGGADADELHGEAGDDLVVAGTGIGDRLYGESGEDRLFGSDEGLDLDTDFTDQVRWGDVLDGGEGDDEIWGLGGADHILGGAGEDRIDSGFGADLVYGGEGNDWLFAGRGLGDTIYGGAGDDTIYGSHFGDDALYGDDGQDQLWGQGGNDRLWGGLGDDYLHGGGGTDVLRGEAGYDELDGGGGSGDQLFGGDDADVLYGSDDGADTLDGEGGDDVLFGRGGNDVIRGGPGNDRLHGGPGDDLIEGGDGTDLLLGEGNHDLLYGNSVGAAGQAAEVDYLYGDFGTHGNEADSGGDRLYGQAGNDWLFGEGGDDFIDGGGTTGDLINFGSGEGATPGAYVTPVTTAAPTVAPTADQLPAQATLPTGQVDAGRWAEWMGSASQDGASGDPGLSVDPAVVVALTGMVYLVWSDTRQGNHEIYVSRFNPASGWESLGTSASGGGISNTPGSSRRPSVAVDAGGNLVVVWTEFAGANSDVRAARWEAGSQQWQSLGNVSGTGSADYARIAASSAGPVVAWLDRSSGAANVWVKQWTGNAWQALGTSAAGRGVSGSATDVSGVALAVDGSVVAVAWSQSVADQRDIMVREYRSSAWQELAGSASSGGISRNLGQSVTPSLAYQAGELFAVWQDDTSGLHEVQGLRYRAGTWQPLGLNPERPQEISATRGYASMPVLSSGGGSLYLAWLDDRIQNRTGETVAIYVRRWVGTQFTGLAALGDDTDRGISLTGGLPVGSALAVDAQGRPVLAWTERGASALEVYLRGDSGPSAHAFHASDGALTVQQILDEHDLQSGDEIWLRGAQPGFTITPSDSGVRIYGLPGATVTGPVTVNGASDVVLQRLRLEGGVTLSQATGVTIRESEILGAGVDVAGGSQTRLAHNWIRSPTGLTLRSGTAGAVVEWNDITGSAAGVEFGTGGAPDVLVRRNTISGEGEGIRFTHAAGGTVKENAVGAKQTGLLIAAAWSGRIEKNEIRGAVIGVRYGAAADLAANVITGNQTGVVSTVDSVSTGFGFVGSLQPNRIVGNGVGVDLKGRMQNQRIARNGTGVSGSGILGPLESLELANVIEENPIGVAFQGVIQFNRLARNGTAIEATPGQQIFHNVLYRQTNAGVRVSGADRVEIFHNTFFSAQGDHIRLENRAREVDVWNNVLWANGGYDLVVANDSRSGFFSDFNDLYAEQSGKLVSWAVDFVDVLDWQADVARHDLHSIGQTAVNPGWARPRFVSVARDDYGVFDLAAGQRFSSPTVDAGAVFVDQALPLAGYRNLLSNGGFETGLGSWTVNPEAVVLAAAPGGYRSVQSLSVGNVAVGSSSQTVDFIASGFTAAQLDSKDYVAVFGGRLRNAVEADFNDDPEPMDEGSLILTFRNAAGQPLGDPVVVRAFNTAERWELIGERVPLPFGTRSVVYRFEAVRRGGTENNALLDGAFLYVLADTVAPDGGALGNTSLEARQSKQAHLALEAPDFYVDWERDLPHVIRWNSFGNDADRLVRIDLFQDGPAGPGLVRTLATEVEDSGRFTWIPANFGVAYGTHGWRIHLSLAGDNTVYTRSAEGYSVPENTKTFFVNDGSRDGDQYTTAAGSNRNTGKLPGAPKPNPVNVLRIYSLGAEQSLQIDPGTYLLHSTVGISNTVGVGNDEGFVMSGPTQASGAAATLRMANPLDVVPLVDLNNADLVRVSHLSLQGGLQAVVIRNESDQITLDHVTATNPEGDGVRLDATSSLVALEWVEVSRSGSDAFDLAGAVGRAEFLVADGSMELGLRIRAEQPVVIANSRFLNNREGGIEAVGPVTIRRSVVSGHHAPRNESPLVAVNVSRGAVAEENVVFDNDWGVVVSQARATANRIYQTTHVAVEAASDADVFDNVVYANGTGLLVRGYDSQIVGNLVYANGVAGIEVRGTGEETVIRNNTIYETKPKVDGIRILGVVEGTLVRNNIVWVQTGYALSVDPRSQPGVASDFNLLYATGSGKIGLWQGTDRATLEAWQNSAFLDRNSLSQDPVFVDVDGADGVLGYGGPAQDGRDDDFHLQSVFGSFHGASLAPVLDPVTGLPAATSALEAKDAATSPGVDRGFPGDAAAQEPVPNGGFINLGFEGGTVYASKSPAEYVQVMAPDGGEQLPHKRTFLVSWRSHDAAGRVRIELLRSGTATPVAVIASDTENDGEYLWTVPEAIAPAPNYLVRIIRGALSDTSNAPFAITPSITAYYVNDATVEVGDWTTVPGNDSNSGLSPSAPKASIRALLESYDLEAGDVIRVDAGLYPLPSNIVITSADAGVRIEGYHNDAFPARAAVIHRGLTNTDSYVFELRDADGITLDHLTITGGYTGVFAGPTSDSDGVVISDCLIHENESYGVRFEETNDGVQIQGNRVLGSVTNNARELQYYGLYLEGKSAVVQRNEIAGHYFGGLEVYGALSEVLNNRVHDNGSTGIYARGPEDEARFILVSENEVYQNEDRGILVTWGAEARNNRVYAQTVSLGRGIEAGGNSRVENNESYLNKVGLYAGGDREGWVRGNRVYGNTSAGIDYAFASPVEDNRVYSNAIGIVSAANSDLILRNNLVYANQTVAARFTAGVSRNQVLFENNTVLHSQGAALEFRGRFELVELVNNIFGVSAGVALSIAPESQLGFKSDFNLYALGNGVNLANWGDMPVSGRDDWFLELGFDAHGLVADPGFVDPDGADNVLGFDATAKVDRGADDDFHLRPGSVGIDRGDPQSYYLREPAPNGSRADLGVYGNSPEATPGLLTSVQVLSPAGLEKAILGQSVAVSWQAYGLTAERSVALIDAGSSVDVERWLADRYRIDEGGTRQLSSSTVNLAGVVLAAPSAVYRSSATAPSGVGQKLAYALPVPNGNYTVRLHFIEDNGWRPGDRVFDIALQGRTVVQRFDIVAEAGATAKGLVREFAVGAVNNEGIRIELANVRNSATLAAIEVVVVNPGVSSPGSVSLAFASSTGQAWSPVNGSPSVDRFGYGVFSWTPTVEVGANTARLRVSMSNGAVAAEGISGAFLVANAGKVYYLNDGLVAPGDLTTAIGNNANSGKDPAHPMASLTALVQAYRPGAGDVVRVDTGSYRVIQNIRLEVAQSGLQIEGFVNASGQRAVFDRQNRTTGSVVFELGAVNDLRIANLGLTGGYHGIYGVGNTARSGIVLEGNEVYGHANHGIHLDMLQSSGVVAGNRVRDNGASGIRVNGAWLVRDNTISGHRADRMAGILVVRGATLTGNVVYDNYDGIVLEDDGWVRDNQVFGNLRAGIFAFGPIDTEIRGNRVTNNPAGLILRGGLDGNIINNVFANNTQQGVLLTGNDYAGYVVGNNTFIQRSGAAIELQDGMLNVTASNNVFALAGGQAFRVEDDSQTGFSSDYNLYWITNGGLVGQWGEFEFVDPESWFYELGFDQNSRVGDPQFVDADGADNVEGWMAAAKVYGGGDDDYRLRPGSLAVDSGDPGSQFLEEPWPNGGRVDIGAYGNTVRATASAAEAVHLITPNGLEKLELGQPVVVRWQSAGYGAARFTALVNSGGGGAQGWAPGAYETSFFRVRRDSDAVSLTGVLNPAPASVYQDMIEGATGIGNQLSLHLPVSDGDYTIRLHFVEYDFGSAGSRVFSIVLQGVTVAESYDIIRAAGRANAAAVAGFDVQAVGGRGIQVALVNRSASYAATLAGVELIARSPQSQAPAVFTLETSSDNGVTWRSVAAGIPADALGRGQMTWSPSSETLGNTGRLRVRVEAGARASDVSDRGFLVTNAGRDFYVNDASYVSGDWTTAPGRNAASGKAPSQPVASIWTLLKAYDLEPGDVIHVDQGSYVVPRNLVLDSEDSGVKLEGYRNADAADRFVVLDRRNASSSAYLVELVDVQGVTIEALRLTGAYTAVYAANTSDSDGLTVRGSEVYANAYKGVFLGDLADRATVADTVFYGLKSGPDSASQNDGVHVRGADPEISGNRIFDHVDAGIRVESSGGRIALNEVYGNAVGIVVRGEDGRRVDVEGNRVHENLRVGIDLDYLARAVDNEVYGHLGDRGVGINLGTDVEAVGNRAYNNARGIQADDSAGERNLIQGNYVFANRGAGIFSGSISRILGNKIYSNAIGVETDAGFTGRVASNVIYGNTEQGILLNGGDEGAKRAAEVFNNTIIQPVGDALRIGVDMEMGVLRNNILSIGSGVAVNLLVGEATRVESGFNMIFKSQDPNAHYLAFEGRFHDTLPVTLEGRVFEAQTVLGDPLFVDPDGADNILGYRAGQGGVDGGADDNFQLLKGSPAIDRADAWSAPTVDALGVLGLDDPGTLNRGSADYVVRELTGSQFEAVGQAQNWRSTFDWDLELPFDFPFYGVNYRTVQVSSAGFIDFVGSPDNDDPNSSSVMAAKVRIAVLWDEITTSGTGDDIFVDRSRTGQITIRWNASRVQDRSDVQFAVTLFQDGRVRMDYGPGNIGLSPTVGISRGDGEHFLISSYSNRNVLTGAPSLEMALMAGASIRDLGAYEFRGSSLDGIPPKVVGVVPMVIAEGGATGQHFGEITVTFSEAVNPIDANARANFDLRRDGGDGVLGNADDQVFTLRTNYVPESKDVVLRVDANRLPPGAYQLTVVGTRSIHDLAGNRLDGDGDGVAGGDYVRRFQIKETVPTVSEVLFNDGLLQRSRVTSLGLVFNVDVSASLTREDLQLRNTSTGAVLASSSLAVRYDTSRNRATVTFNLQSGLLPAGDYELRVLAVGVRGPDGTAMAEDFEFEFAVQPGDTNGDGLANDLDLFGAWLELLKPVAERDLNFDMNGDRQVNQEDLNLIKAHYLGGAERAGLMSQAPDERPRELRTLSGRNTEFGHRRNHLQ